MKRIALLALGAALTLSSASLPASHPIPATPDEVEQRITRIIHGLRPSAVFRNQQRYGPPATLQERMAYYHTPGVSIAVVNNYQLEWARGFGVCEQGKRKPVTETTLFQAASISKPIVALAVMRLAQAGRLDLDEDVNRYLKSWKVPANGSWQPRITLRQILSHSAGLTVHGFPGYRKTDPIPSLPDILDGRPPANTLRVEVTLLPGVQARYSGGGTTAAGLLLADVLGQPLPQIMRELVLEPLAMTASTFEQPLPAKRAKHAATAHSWLATPIAGRWHIYPELAPDGLWTTPADLARAGLELQRAWQGKGNGFLSRSNVAEMLTPVVDGVGIGFMIEEREHSVRFGHGGANEGFLSQMTMCRDEGRGAVIMINSDEGGPLLREIERAIALEYGWPGAVTPDRKAVPVSAGTLAQLVGDYVGKAGFQCRIDQSDGRLFLKAGAQPPLELHPESESTFFLAELNAEITFDRTDAGEVTGLRLLQDGRTTSAKRRP